MGDFRRRPLQAFYLAIGLFWGHGLAAQTALPGPAATRWSLTALALQAAGQDPTLRAATAALTSDTEAVAAARAGLGPRLDLALQRGSNQIARDVGQSQRYASESTSLSVRQSLLQMEGRARVEGAEADVRRQQALLAQAADRVWVGSVAAYADLVRQAYDLTAAQASLAVANGNLQAAERGRSNGLVSDTEVSARRGRAEQARQRWLVAQWRRDDALRQVERSVARPVHQVAMPDPTAAPWPFELPSALEPLRTKALADAQAVRAAEEAIRSASATVDRARAASQPTLDLVGAYTRAANEGPSTVNSAYRVRSIGLQLNVPLYQGGAGDAVVRQSLAQKDRAEALRDAARMEVEAQWESDVRWLQGSQVQLASTREVIRSARQLLESELRGVDQGVRSSLDVLEARAQLARAEADDAQAWTGAVLAWMRLMLLVGRDATEVLQSLDRWLTGTLDLRR